MRQNQAIPYRKPAKEIAGILFFSPTFIKTQELDQRIVTKIACKIALMRGVLVVNVENPHDKENRNAAKIAALCLSSRLGITDNLSIVVSVSGVEAGEGRALQSGGYVLGSGRIFSPPLPAYKMCHHQARNAGAGFVLHAERA